MTVIRIGENSNEVNLPYVLQDRNSKGPTSGNWSTPKQQLSSPNQGNIVVVNADITPQEEEDQLKKFGTPEIRNVGRLFTHKGK